MSDWDDSPSSSPQRGFPTKGSPFSILNQQSRDDYEQLVYRLNVDQHPEDIHIPGTNPPNPALLQSSSGDENCGYSSPNPKTPDSCASDSRSSPLEMSPTSSEGSSTPVRRSSISSESRTPPLTRAENTSQSLNDNRPSDPSNDNLVSTFSNDSYNAPLSKHDFDSLSLNVNYESLQMGRNRTPPYHEENEGQMLLEAFKNSSLTTLRDSPKAASSSSSRSPPDADSRDIDSLPESPPDHLSLSKSLGQLIKKPSNVSSLIKSPIQFPEFSRSPTQPTSPPYFAPLPESPPYFAPLPKSPPSFSPEPINLPPLPASPPPFAPLPKSPPPMAPLPKSPPPVPALPKSPPPATLPSKSSPILATRKPKSHHGSSSKSSLNKNSVPKNLQRDAISHKGRLFVSTFTPINERESYTPPLPPPPAPKNVCDDTKIDERKSYTPPLPPTSTSNISERESYTPPLPATPSKDTKSPNLEIERKMLEAVILPERISLPSTTPPPLPEKSPVVKQSFTEQSSFLPSFSEPVSTIPETIPLPSSPPTESNLSLPNIENSFQASCNMPMPSSLTPAVSDFNINPPPDNFVQGNDPGVAQYAPFEQINGPPLGLLGHPPVPNPQINHIGNPFLYFPPQNQAPNMNMMENIPGMNHGMIHPNQPPHVPGINHQNMGPMNFGPQMPHPPAPPFNPDGMENCIPHKRMKGNNLQKPNAPLNNGDFYGPPRNDNQFPPQSSPVNNHNNFHLPFNEDHGGPHHPNPPFFQNGNNVHNAPVPSPVGKNFAPRSGSTRPPLLRSPILQSPPDGNFPGPHQPFPPRPRNIPPAGLRPPLPPANPNNEGPIVVQPAPPGVPGNLWQWFLTADQDKDGYITAPELQCILLNGNWSPFSEERCRMMVDMLDRERTGTINAYELTTIWNCLCEWKACFEEMDVENFGHVNCDQLMQAFSKFGYNLSEEFSKVVINHFESDVEQKLMFDDFIHSCIMLKSLTDAFQVYDTNKVGTIDLHYEQFLEMVLDNIVGSPYHPV